MAEPAIIAQLEALNLFLQTACLVIAVGLVLIAASFIPFREESPKKMAAKWQRLAIVLAAAVFFLLAYVAVWDMQLFRGFCC